MKTFNIQTESGDVVFRGVGEDNAYLRAYGYYRMARYPAPNSPGKRAAYDKSVELFLAGARYLDPPLERVVLPFAGRPGEGDAVIGYLRRPPGSEPVPIVFRWGGIDTFNTLTLFCIPHNDLLYGYWDTVADRLFKIRHCMNISGQERQLAPASPPSQ